MEQLIKRYVEPCRSEWKSLCDRRMDDDSQIEERVKDIIERVANSGDIALCGLASEIDGIRIQNIEVAQNEFDEVVESVAEPLRNAIEKAMQNIVNFHTAQLPKPVRVETSPGVVCLQKAVPIERVGLYVPGGTAPLFSTVLMLAVPAKVAGCKEIILCTPPRRDGKVDPVVLFTAMKCGIRRVFKAGGAQAIAAMAYGTETIPAVDKIFGPGNRYVTKAKEMLSSRVAIDMPAGPSEVLVLADDTAVPAFVASDLLSQAEHGADSQAILVCPDEKNADAVCNELAVQLNALPRKELAVKALENSRVVVLADACDRVDFVNMYAPEHLIISAENPWGVAENITAAGSVFIGNYSPESAGDYASGTNHTLPTSGWARSHSGVNIDSFIRKITYQELTADGIMQLGDIIVEMARAEGLDAHANAAVLRMNNIRK